MKAHQRKKMAQLKEQVTHINPHKLKAPLHYQFLTCKTLLSASSPVITSTFANKHFLAVALV